MKKIFLLLCSAVLSLGLSAQGISNSDLWGYYLGDDADLYGLGINDNQSHTFRVCIFVPGNGVLRGARITGVNLPFLAEAMPTNVSVYAGSTAGSKATFEQAVASVVAGYNAVALDSAVAIPTTGLYVTYQFTASGYCVAMAHEEEVSGSVYLSTSATGSMDNYAGEGLGVSAMQIYVEGVSLPANAVTITSLTAADCAMGSTDSLYVKLSSSCSAGVQSIGYTLTVNGVQTTGTQTLVTPISSGLLKKGETLLSFVAPNAAGNYTGTLAITTVNGEENATPTSATFQFGTVSRIVPRLTVVEEFTGTGCGYCPRGWVGMEAVKERKSDKAVVLAYHQYNSADPMFYSSSYIDLNYLGFTGAPQCCVDRKTYPDPYHGNGGENGILDDVDEYSAIVPGVAVNVEGAFAGSNTINVSASAEFLRPTNGSTLVFVITADSLTGTSYKQSNYYYSGTASQAGVLPAMPLFRSFCKAGKYAKSAVQLVFNDVVIASSYVSNVNQVSALGNRTTGDIVTRTYSMTMPTKAALVNALNYEEIYVTAMVVDNQGKIANAARAKVSTDYITALENVEVAPQSGAKEGIYNVMGVRLSEPQPGVNIINGKKVVIMK